MKTEVGLNLQTATVRGVSREVLSLREAPRHLYVRQHDCFDHYLYADAGGYARLAEIAAVAATEPTRALFVPKGVARPDGPANLGEGNPCALLFVHHTAQMRPGDWREIRRRLGPSHPVSRATRFEVDPEDKPLQSRSSESDPVDLSNHADTLIVSGSPPVFRALAHLFAWLSGAGNDCHMHFRDSLTLRRHDDRAFKKDPTPDVICFGWTRWQEEPPFPRYDYRWVYPGFSPFQDLDSQGVIDALAEDGWEFVYKRDITLVFRRPVV
jgi:hypothetical protein